MAATPLTDQHWAGLPLLECSMNPGRYHLSMQVPRLITRVDVGTQVEVFDQGSRRVAFRQAAQQFDLFGPGIDIMAVSDRVATKSLVVALPGHWMPADEDRPGERLALRPRFQFGDTRLRRLVWRLSAYHARGAQLGDPYSHALSQSIVDRVVSLQIIWAQGGRGLDPEAQRLVVMMIRERLRESLTVARLARDLGMSAARLAREFRATFKTTPHHYILQQRLQRALELLRHTDAPLTTVALECGFSSHSHLSASFRAAMGLTPSAFRQRHGVRRDAADTVVTPSAAADAPACS